MVTLAAQCSNVLLTGSVDAKVMAARKLARDWRLGRLAWQFDVAMPSRPARPQQPVLLPPGKMPRRRGGSLEARIALLHALAHIEFVAIDLAVDLVGRFGSQMPRGFCDDWLSVAADEAMHFVLLDRRLRQLGSHYGAYPAHDGLWEAAEATAHDVTARLAVVPMVLEARALDVSPATIGRFQASGDEASARILERILDDEIRHVRFGTSWFSYLCQNLSQPPEVLWKTLVESYFSGRLKGPFNDSARQSAGLTRSFYGVLAL